MASVLASSPSPIRNTSVSAPAACSAAVSAGACQSATPAWLTTATLRRPASSAADLGEHPGTDEHVVGRTRECDGHPLHRSLLCAAASTASATSSTVRSAVSTRLVRDRVVRGLTLHGEPLERGRRTARGAAGGRGPLPTRSSSTRRRRLQPHHDTRVAQHAPRAGIEHRTAAARDDERCRRRGNVGDRLPFELAEARLAELLEDLRHASRARSPRRHRRCRRTVGRAAARTARPPSSSPRPSARRARDADRRRSPCEPSALHVRELLDDLAVDDTEDVDQRDVAVVPGVASPLDDPITGDDRLLDVEARCGVRRQRVPTRPAPRSCPTNRSPSGGAVLSNTMSSAHTRAHRPCRARPTPHRRPSPPRAGRPRSSAQRLAVGGVVAGELGDGVAPELAERLGREHERDHRLGDDARRRHRGDVGALLEGDGLLLGLGVDRAQRRAGSGWPAASSRPGPRAGRRWSSRPRCRPPASTSRT